MLERLITLLSEKILGGSAKLKIRMLADFLKQEGSVGEQNPTSTDFSKMIADAQMFDDKMAGLGLVDVANESAPTER